MAKKSQVKKAESERDQAAAFRKAARELGCDDSEEQFQGALRKIARHKPKDEKPPERKPGKP
jgi:hypothetical protein